VIEIGERSKKSPLLQSNIEVAKNRRAPEWLDWSDEGLTAKVSVLPSREQIDTPVDEQLIVEYYSR
jgi:small subunit ribosomal protein S4